MRDFEASVFARCTAILPISENERAEAYRLFAHPNAVVLENGVDTEAFAPTPIPEAPHLLFTGVMNYDPNPEAIRYFVREIFPTILAGEPRATLTVVGKNPPNDVLALDVGSGGAVRVTGFVPEVAPYFAEARVCIVPLLSGGGVRNKILEALAAGRPVVSTSLGAEGLDLEPSRHLLLADSPDAFAAATLRLLRDGDLCERMAHAGRERVVSRYDWNTLARKLDATLTACASSG
jgi:glycosyltransferase involved in cell wall biosynthesis